eukprot:Em0012g1047a
MTLDVSGATVTMPAQKAEKDFWPLAFHEMMAVSLDFPPKAHHLSRWYGITEFIVLAPEEGSDALTSQAQANLMLSTVSIAIANTGCETPVFVQVQQNWRQMYLGVCQGKRVRTNFDMVHLHHTPPQYSHLSGLLDVFKDRLRCPLPKMDPVSIAIRFTYVLRHWSLDEWPVEPLGGEQEGLGATLQGMLPVGALSDPVQELHLSAVWPNLTEEFVVHNSAHSDLNPTNAPVWTVRLALAKQSSSLLGHTHEEFSELVGSLTEEDDITRPPDFSTALSRLTDPNPNVIGSPVLSAAMSYSSSQRVELASQREAMAMVGTELDEVVTYLFPSAADTKAGGLEKGEEAQWVRSAPEGSFTSRLVKALCMINYRFGIEAFSKVWKMVLSKLRLSWEKGNLLSYLGTGAPDMGSSLFHQKLEMLNCCIHHKITRKNSNITTTTTTTTPNPTSTTATNVTKAVTSSVSLASVRKCSMADSGESDEEFYEALESQDSDTKATPSQTQGSEQDGGGACMEPHPFSLPANTKETTDGQRSGALKPCGDLLLLVTGEPLYIPVTQEHAPMTEDMMWEQQGVLAKLGTSEEAARVRAKMQSLSLVSDMQAFKAANPGCLLEDFVRWYSPRDWEEGEEEEEEEKERKREEEGAKSSTGSLPGSSKQLVQQNDQLASSVMSERLGDWGDEGEDWDMILGNNQAGAKAETFTASEAKVEEPATSKDGPSSPRKRYTKGRLSRRMQQTDNIWIESWQLATPLPAYKQKRLFDDTREAEKVLHYFEKFHPNVCGQKLDQHPLTGVISHLQDVNTLLSTIHHPSVEAIPKFQECASLLSQAELLLAAEHSLRIKLQRGLELMSCDAGGKEGSGVGTEVARDPLERERKEVNMGVGVLVESPELTVKDPAHSAMGRALQGLMMTQVEEGVVNTFPPETGREFILRSVLPSPGVTSCPCPQRMFCVLTKDQFRLAGAFSNDITSS